MNPWRCVAGAYLTAMGCVWTFSGPVFSADSTSPEENWPQWRGPLATGVAPAADPPTTWSETSNVKWKVRIPGRGTATPIVWGDKVFVQTAIPKEKDQEKSAEKGGSEEPPKVADKPTAPPAADPPRREGDPPRRGPGRGFSMRSVRPTEPLKFTVLCLDRATGKTVWRTTLREELPHEGHHPDHGFSSHSPVTDGQHIFAYFGSRGLHCLDMQGNLLWSKDLGKMRTKNSFGEGSSPALAGNLVIVNWDHEGEDFIAAFDKETGKEVWRQARDEETSWGTPIVVRHGDQTQVVTSATRRVRGYDLATGKLLWECAGLGSNAIPSPVAADGMVFATSGFRGSALLAIRLGATGDLTETDAVAWKLTRSTPYVPSPLLYGDRLYFYASNNAILSCFAAKTGKALVEPQRVEGMSGVYASPVGAGGRVYLVGRDGKSVVIRDADKLEILATNRLDDRFDASPAAAGKELFLRGHTALYCIAQR
jgi:outer membrane protein assembly factor BamB